jgi:hypothetical protein
MSAILTGMRTDGKLRATINDGRMLGNTQLANMPLGEGSITDCDLTRLLLH